MKKLIDFSVRHPVSILMGVLTLVLLGILSFFIIAIDFLPVINARKLLIATEYEGIPAKEIRSMITLPLEDAFASLKGLKAVNSISRDGLSLITIELHWGNDIDMALVECREIIDVAFEALPSRCSKPVVQQSVAGEKNTLSIAVIPHDNDLQYGRYITDTDIKPRLQRLNGVGFVSVSGGEKEQIEVQVYRDKMETRQITLQVIGNALSAANFEYPAGTIREGEKELLVKTSGLYSSIAEIGKTPLMYNEGGLLRISDIAEVVRTIEKKQTFFLYNGRECIRVGITKKNDASPVSVSDLVKEELGVLEQIYGRYYTFQIIEDLSVQIVESLISLIISAVAGIFVTAVIILIFLKSWQIAILLSSVIPVSAFASVFTLMAAGKTLNILSLSGIAIGIGMVIDCSAVVLENLQKKLTGSNTQNFQDVIVEGTSAVALSNVGSTLTTIIVFIPVFFLKGLLGELFTDMAISIVASIFMSCALSLTYIPAMFTLMAPLLPRSPENSFYIKRIELWYKKYLGVFFKKKLNALFLTGVCVLIGVISIFCIRYELLPSLAVKTITAQVSFADGTTVEALQEAAQIIGERILKEQYVQDIHISGGIDSADYQELSIPDALKEKIFFTLNVNIPAAEAEKRIRQVFDGSRYEVVFSGKKDMLSQLLSIQEGRFVVCAEDPEQAVLAAKQYTRDERQIIPNVFVKEFVFVPNRVAAARFSVSALYTAALARDSLEGIQTLPYYENGRQIPVLVKLHKADVRRIPDLEDTGVQLENALVPLRSLGRFEQETNEKVLYRYNRKDAKIINSPVLTVTTQENALISLRDLEVSEMLGEGIFLLAIIIVLLYLVMGAQFESFTIPALLLFSLLPAFSGAFLFLVVFGKTLNVNSIIALVVLFGTSVNNAILLYENCISVPILSQQTIIQSCSEKLRAIIITNLTTMCALIPFAIDPFNRHAQSSLALAIIGGLLFSVVLVLFVVPILFSVSLTGRKKHE